MPSRKRLERNPNAGKKHPKAWDSRRNANYAHRSNLKRMGKDSLVTSYIDKSIKGTAVNPYGSLSNDPDFR